jgi:methylenetetrahydrofolate reductase (NADPH)
MHTTVTPVPASALARRLAAGKFVMTAEIVPPVSCDAADLLARALPLKGVADAVNVTDGAGARAHMAATAAAVLLAQAGIEPILQFTCRDRNRIALQSDLMGAAAMGIRNLLVLRGDDPTAGDQPDAKPVFDLDSRTLAETVRLIRDEGRLPHGAAVAGRPAFFIGAADMPIDPPPGWWPDVLAAKVEAGAQFVQTQFCMPGSCAATWRGSPRPGSPTACRSSSGSILCARRSRRPGCAIISSAPSSPTPWSRAWKPRPIRLPKAGASASNTSKN